MEHEPTESSGRPSPTTSSPLRVCFTAHHAYPLFDPTVRACVGGRETHAWLLANGLASETDSDVHFVVQAPVRFRRRPSGPLTVWNRGDGWDAVRADVARRMNIEKGWPRLLDWSPRLLWQVPLLALVRPFRNPPPVPTEPDPFYRQIDTDILCCFGVSGESASVVASARAAGRPSVLFLESNTDLDARFGPGSNFVTPYGERGDVCGFAIRHATQIVAQQSEQQRLLQERFQRDCIVLPNLIDLTAWDRLSAAVPPQIGPAGDGRFVLWVGRADDFHKRPLLCLELARKLDPIRFVMILNPFDEQIERRVREQAPQNVTIVDAVPYTQMPALLAQTELLVSTGSCEFEGAPNVFLQAAASVTPVASLEVPLPTTSHAGLVADGDLQRLADYIDDVWRHPERGRAAGRSGRADVERDYALPVVVGRLNHLLADVHHAAHAGQTADQ